MFIVEDGNKHKIRQVLEDPLAVMKSTYKKTLLNMQLVYSIHIVITLLSKVMQYVHFVTGILIV